MGHLSHHYSGAPPATWYELAGEVFEIAGRLGYPAPRLDRTDSASFDRPAPRPADSTLDSSLIRRTFGIEPAPWRKAVREVVGTLLSSSGSEARA